MKKTILVTGAAGFIGYHLSDHLLNEGHYVIGVDDLNEYYDADLKRARLDKLHSRENFRFIREDISNASEIEKIFSKFRPSVVVNLAAQAGVRYSIENPEAYIRSNIIGFHTILECCRHNKVEHLVFASSSSVYGNQKKIPFSESDNTDRPISLYAATKKSNEEMAYSYSSMFGIPITGLRFFTVYGPMGRPDMAYYKFADNIRQGKTIELYNHGDLLRDFTYVGDVVKATEKVIKTIPGPDPEGVRYKVYNIGKGSPEKLLDFVEIIERLYGKHAVKEMKEMQPGDVYQTYADTSLITKDLKYRPDTTLEKGLALFMDWYKEYYGLGANSLRKDK